MHRHFLEFYNYIAKVIEICARKSFNLYRSFNVESLKEYL